MIDGLIDWCLTQKGQFVPTAGGAGKLAQAAKDGQ